MTGATARTRETIATLFRLFDDGTDASYGSNNFLALVAQDCDWREASVDPRFAGRQGNRDDLESGVTESAADLRARRARIQELIVDDDRAVARWIWSAEGADGMRHSAEVLTMFTVRDGLIQRWHDWISPSPGADHEDAYDAPAMEGVI